jgi:hypothetical protein
MQDPDDSDNRDYQELGLLPDGSVLVQTQTLHLESERPRSLDDDRTERLAEAIAQWLHAVRVVAKQPQGPRNLVTLAFSDSTPSAEASQYRDASSRSKVMVRNYLIESAATPESAVAAADAVETHTLPVHGEMVTDAAEALFEASYRNALILAAIACESCAGVVLESAYKNLMAQGASCDSRFRFVSTTIDRNTVKLHDPIYECLTNARGEGNSRFLALMHEQPLYILGRSLRLETPDLYRDVHALYRTRSRLVHSGSAVDTQGLLPVDRDGAHRGVSTANRVLEWFGEQGTTVPDLGFSAIQAIRYG